jgi:hypothetical protein
MILHSGRYIMRPPNSLEMAMANVEETDQTTTTNTANTQRAESIDSEGTQGECIVCRKPGKVGLPCRERECYARDAIFCRIENEMTNIDPAPNPNNIRIISDRLPAEHSGVGTHVGYCIECNKWWRDGMQCPKCISNGKMSTCYARDPLDNCWRDPGNLVYADDTLGSL